MKQEKRSLDLKQNKAGMWFEDADKILNDMWRKDLCKDNEWESRAILQGQLSNVKIVNLRVEDRG